METTPFSVVYNNFFSRITDDMFLELDKIDTEKILEELLMQAIPLFEFPKVSLDFCPSVIETVMEEEWNPDTETMDLIPVKKITQEGYFKYKLTLDEISVLASYMVVYWLGYQLASVENVRMKYSGSDYKLTSQANHMAKLQSLKNNYQQQAFHLQRLYNRRRIGEDGVYVSNLDKLDAAPAWRKGGEPHAYKI